MKTCSKCKETKQLSEFHKQTSSPDGLRGHCKVCVTAYTAAVAESRRAYHQQYREANKAKKLDYNKEYYESRRTEVRAQQKEYWQQNYKKFAKKKQERTKQFRKENAVARLKHSLRSRLSTVLRGKNKSTQSQALLGCTWEQARAHIEAQFKPGMTWENYSYDSWHIDHIWPLVSFDLTDPAQQQQAFHYTNLQPLWAHENLSKGAKVPTDLAAPTNPC